MSGRRPEAERALGFRPRLETSQVAGQGQGQGGRGWWRLRRAGAGSGGGGATSCGELGGQGISVGFGIKYHPGPVFRMCTGRRMNQGYCRTKTVSIF